MLRPEKLSPHGYRAHSVREWLPALDASSSAEARAAGSPTIG